MCQMVCVVVSVSEGVYKGCVLVGVRQRIFYRV